MTWRGLACGAIFLGGYGFCSGDIAGGSDQSDSADNANPYALINERNPFRMNPLPPPPPPESLRPAPELPEVILSGTMIVAGQQKAMFAVKIKEPKDPKVKAAAPPQETTVYLCLVEGEISGPVQLLKIKKGGDEVEIMNSGTRMTLNMKENGFAKDTSSPARGANNPNNPPPNMQLAGQPAAQPGGSGGISVGGAGSESYRSGFNTAGNNAANPGGGTLSGGFNQNRAGISQPASFAGNNNGVISSGYSPPAAPVTSVAPIGLNSLSFTGNLGSQSSMTPNNTPTTSTPMRNIPMPPSPPGQQK
jgi:hypothetical protein